MRLPTLLAKLPLVGRFLGGDRPDINTLLAQNTYDGEIPGYVRRVIGTFNPREVTHDLRLLMRLDPDVAFATAIIRAPIINLRWSVESKDPEIAAYVEAALRPRYRELAKAASTAPLMGFRVIEPAWQTGPLSIQVKGKADGSATWKTIPVAWTYRKFRAIDSRTLTMIPDEAGEFLGVRQSLGVLKGTNGLAPADRLVLWSFRDEDVDGRLDGFPLYDQAYEPWYWKAAMNLFANRYFERRADPIPKGRAPVSTKDDKGRQVDGQALLVQQILAARNGGAFVLPPTVDEKTGKYTWDIEYLEDSGKAPAAYQARIDKLGVQIFRGLLLPEEAVSATEMGGRARSEEHGARLDDSLQSIVDEFVDEVLNPQVVDPLVRFFKGEEAVRESGTRVKAAGLSGSMRTLLKEVLFKVMEAEAVLDQGGTIPTRKRIAAAQVLNMLDVPMVPEDEIEPEPVKEEPAEGDEEVEITPEMEEGVRKELARSGALEE